MKMPTTAEVIEYARFCIGTPYRRFGRFPGSGLDCVGLVLAVAMHFDIVLQSPNTYRLSHDAPTVINWCRSSGLEQIETIWQPGTIAVLQLPRVLHLAIVTPSGIVEVRNDREIRKTVEHPVSRSFIAQHHIATFALPGVGP